MAFRLTRLFDACFSVVVGVLAALLLSHGLEYFSGSDSAWGLPLIAAVVAGTASLAISNVIRSVATLKLAHAEALGRLRRLEQQPPAPPASTLDRVTGLPGREAFEAVISRRLTTAEITGPFAVGAIRAMRVLDVNVAHGRAVAEQLLCDIGQRLRRGVRVTDQVAHLYGETFAVLFEGISDESCGEAQVTRLHGAMAEPFRVGGDEIVVHPDVGLVVDAVKYHSAEGVLRAAEIALASARKPGAQVHVFRSEMQTLAKLELKIETDLRHAVGLGEIVVHYQPIIRLRDRALVGYEALVRWVRRSGGMVNPLDFIPIAESTGAIVGIGHEVLRQACEQLVAWTESGVCGPDTTMAVNVSPVQLVRTDFGADVLTVLATAGLDPSRLKLEVTESVMIEDIRCTVAVLGALRERGVQIAVDDFGTGHSSLAYLQRLPIDILKVDRSFVSRMRADHESAQIVRTVISLARTLELDVVAEGVESELDFVMLDQSGCQYAQGYFMSRPLAPAAVPAFDLEWEQRRHMIAPSRPVLVAEGQPTAASARTGPTPLRAV
jgi:predicted signal transduction protein with EAL and GGDEF domain